MRMYLGQDALDDPNSHPYTPIISGKPFPTKETLVRAYWRTLVKDCSAPPRMRRLLKPEIESLDTINQDCLKGGLRLRTFQIPLDMGTSKSAFSYDPGEGFDFVDVEDSENLVAVYLPWQSYSDREWIFVRTDNGLFLLARPSVREGDVVAILDGGKVPMVLRKAGSNHGYRGAGEVYHIVCSTYVHGFMDGEAEKGVAEGWLKKQEFLVA
ncbi:hypothetical protein ACHAPT_013443 [Fusarium lateritium]